MPILFLFSSLHTYVFAEDLLPHAYIGEYVDFYWLNALTSFWLFQLVLVSNWYPWAREHIPNKRSSLYLRWAYLMFEIF